LTHSVDFVSSSLVSTLHLYTYYVCVRNIIINSFIHLFMRIIYGYSYCSDEQCGYISGLKKLRLLDLSRNRIAVLPDGALRHSPKLQRVILDSNRLTTLRQCTLATGSSDLPPYLRTLSLVGNPLYCDCRLSWLVDVQSPTVVWWAACRGGIDDNQTNVIRHHSYYYDLRRDVCVESAATYHDCPFTLWSIQSPCDFTTGKLLRWWWLKRRLEDAVLLQYSSMAWVSTFHSDTFTLPRHCS